MYDSSGNTQSCNSTEPVHVVFVIVFPFRLLKG